MAWPCWPAGDVMPPPFPSLPFPKHQFIHSTFLVLNQKSHHLFWIKPLTLGAFGVFPMVQMWNYHWYRWLPMVPMVTTKLRTVLAYQWHDSTFLLVSDPHRPHRSQSLGPDANFAFRRCDAIIWGKQYIFFLKI